MIGSPGLAVAGTFGLVRFRSVAGTAREIGGIFRAMAVDLATGMGYLGTAALFTLAICAVQMLLTFFRFGKTKRTVRELSVVIPENLDYTGLFDDIFQRYTSRYELIRVRTTNLGSLYKLKYQVTLKDPAQEKQMLDEIRCRNGNLDISCGRSSTGQDEL